MENHDLSPVNVIGARVLAIAPFLCLFVYWTIKTNGRNEIGAKKVEEKISYDPSSKNFRYILPAGSSELLMPVPRTTSRWALHWPMM